MDATCWKVVALMSAAVVGLVGAVGVLWRAYRGAHKALIKAKQDHIKVLEAIKRHVQEG